MHAAEDRKNCIQSVALQFKSNIRETWRVILVSEADKSYQSHCVSSRDRNNCKTSAIIINSSFTNVKKKSILYMFGHCTWVGIF